MEKLVEVAEIRDHQARDLVGDRTRHWSLRLVGSAGDDGLGVTVSQ